VIAARIVVVVTFGAVACHGNAAVPDAACPVVSDPNAAKYPSVCRAGGLRGSDVSGTRQLLGTSNYNAGGSDSVSQLETTATIDVTGCATSLVVGDELKDGGAATDTVLTYIIAADVEYWYRWVCIRDSDGALVYSEESAGQSAGAVWTESAAGVLTR
jgi:hypothetical protein